MAGNAQQALNQHLANLTLTDDSNGEAMMTAGIIFGFLQQGGLGKWGG